jgi:DNA-directed RNA polymerase specialized sigma24 family protein
MTLEHTRRRGVDHSGVIRSRTPGATTVALGGTEPVSREPAPGAGIEERQSIEAIKQALGRLPHSLQVPLLESMRGRPAHVIAEDVGVSESTARRRIQEARDSVRDELGRYVDDRAGVSYDMSTDPVLERSQRSLELSFAPSLDRQAGRALDR